MRRASLIIAKKAEEDHIVTAKSFAVIHVTEAWRADNLSTAQAHVLLVKVSCEACGQRRRAHVHVGELEDSGVRAST